MLLTVEYLHSEYGDKTLYVGAVLDEDFVNERTLTEALGYLMQVNGKSYSDFSQKYSRLMQRLLDLGESLTVFLNFLHTLHAHKFDGDDMASLLFKYYSELIRGYGCDFEEALSVVEFASALLP
jgi:hypothetical protein